jgi:hypothetical protein
LGFYPVMHGQQNIKVLEKYVWKIFIVLVNVEEIVTRHSFSDILRYLSGGCKIIFLDVFIILYIFVLFIVAWNRFSNRNVGTIT